MQDTVFEDVWNGWTPIVSHEEHDQALSYANEQAFVDEIQGFSSTDRYVMRWRGHIVLPTDGVYTFSTRSDDGSMLYIDENPIVNNDGLHGATTQEGQTEYLVAGTHAITITFFENGGVSSLQVQWMVPGDTEFQDLSTDVLTNDIGCGGAAGSSSTAPGATSLYRLSSYPQGRLEAVSYTHLTLPTKA